MKIIFKNIYILFYF